MTQEPQPDDICEICNGSGVCGVCDYSHLKSYREAVCRCPGFCPACGGTGKAPKDEEPTMREEIKDEK